MSFSGDYVRYFDVARRNVSDKACNYLCGLLMKAPRKNMERMEEYVDGYDYQSQQQFLSDSPWSHRALMDRVALDTGSLLGGARSALIIDEAGFEKKGVKSAGVARQYLGRLGKVENGQVGVFAALSDGTSGGLVDARLFLPEEWTEDAERCEAAKIPESERKHRSKPQLALEMIVHAEALGLEFGWVGFDALYGSTPWLLRAIEDRGRIFVGDARSNARVYLANPEPYLPENVPGAGRKHTRLKARGEAVELAELFAHGQRQWKEVLVREGTKGAIRVSACAERVWCWDSKEKQARCWWAVCTVEDSTGETKFFLSNAPASTTLEELVRKHAVRFWIERAFQDGKTSVGMADYQARGWPAWHHHMAMVMLAMLFLLRERRVHLVDVEMLSCQDIVELLNVFLPRHDLTLNAVIKNIERRHRKRRDASDSAKRASETRYAARRSQPNPEI